MKFNSLLTSAIPVLVLAATAVAAGQGGLTTPISESDTLGSSGPASNTVVPDAAWWQSFVWLHCDGLVEAGDVLAALESTDPFMPSQQMQQRAGLALLAAAGNMQFTADEIDLLIEQGLEQGYNVGQGSQVLYHQLAASLEAAGQGLVTDNLALTSAALADFQEQLEQVLRYTKKDSFPAPHLSATTQEAIEVADIAQTAAWVLEDLQGQAETATYVQSLAMHYVEQSGNLAGVAKCSAYVEAREQRLLQSSGGLRPQSGTTSSSVSHNDLAHPEVTDWSYYAIFNSSQWTEQHALLALSDALADTGNHMISLGLESTLPMNLVLFVGIGCYEECQTDEDCGPCEIEEACLIPGGHNPNSTKAIDKLARFLQKKARVTVLSTAIKAIRGYATMLLPTVWIKVKYPDCHWSNCYLIWDESDCEMTAGEWVQIRAQNPVDSAPLPTWDARTWKRYQRGAQKYLEKQGCK